MGDSAANGDKNDPVVFSGAVEAQMRKLVADYGFDRLPLTYGELQGLVEYCHDLDSATGRWMFDTDDERRVWQGDFKVWRKHRPHLFPAVELYAEGNLEALRQLHRREDTLTRLGKAWREFDE